MDSFIWSIVKNIFRSIFINSFIIEIAEIQIKNFLKIKQYSYSNELKSNYLF